MWSRILRPGLVCSCLAAPQREREEEEEEAGWLKVDLMKEEDEYKGVHRKIR